MSAPRNDQPFPSALAAIRREAANWRHRCRAAEAKIDELVAQIAKVQAENQALRSRLEDLDPVRRPWPAWKK